MASGVEGKKNPYAERDERRYSGVIASAKDLPADVSTDIVDVLDDTYAQEELCEGYGGSFFTRDNRFAFSTDLKRLQRPVTLRNSSLLTLYGTLLIKWRPPMWLRQRPKRRLSGRKSWLPLPRSRQ